MSVYVTEIEKRQADEIKHLRVALGSAKVALMNRRNAGPDWERMAAAAEKDVDTALSHKE